MGFSFLNTQAYHRATSRPARHQKWQRACGVLIAAAWVLLTGCNNAPAPASKQRGQADDPAALKVAWVRSSERRAPTVIVMHGYGARGDDLLPLARRLNERAPYHYAVVEAPIALSRGGRSWWPIDFQAREAQFKRGEGLDLRKQAPPELAQARAQVMALIAQIKRSAGIDERKLALVGFSQGAMLSLDTALHMDAAPACVGFLSGSFLNEEAWRARFSARRGMPLFMSHGTQDTILPLPLSEALRDALEARGVPVSFVRFEGGHSIPREVVERLAAFLGECFG